MSLTCCNDWHELARLYCSVRFIEHVNYRFYPNGKTKEVKLYYVMVWFSPLVMDLNPIFISMFHLAITMECFQLNVYEIKCIDTVLVEFI